MSVKLIAEEMSVSSEPGIDIYVRNKRPADLTSFSPERTLLFVHGSTYPAHAGFDLPLGGQSWMEYIASRGYDVYCLDLRGYGRSTRPKAMSEPPANNPPVMRTPDAVKDITAVLNAVLKRRNIPRLNLLGWSWGCALMSITTVQNLGQGRAPDAATHRRGFAPDRRCSTVRARSRRYRLVSEPGARERWLNGVPEHKKAALIPAGWFEQWATPSGRPIRTAANTIRRCCARRTARWPTRASSGRTARRSTTRPKSPCRP